MSFLKRVAFALIMLAIFVPLAVITLIQMTLSLIFGNGRRGWRLIVAYDQVGSTALGGSEKATVSSRCWVFRARPKYEWFRRRIDWLFLVLANEADHCEATYKHERKICSDRFNY